MYPMIRVRQVKVDINSDIEDIKKICARKLKISLSSIKSLSIHKQSLDARKKPQLYYVYEVDITCDNEDKVLRKNKKDVFPTPKEKYQFEITGTKNLNNRPIIVGSGPAGLFCAYMLALNGYQPIIIERGECIENRIETVNKFWEKGILNSESNVQFGEGGAGTFSDGKLNSQIKDKKYRIKKMLEIFVEAGAPKEILYVNNPHIGTDLLRNVIINMRKKIISYGGEFRYSTCLTDIIINNNKISEIEVNYNEKIKCDLLILGLGHSAYDTFEMLLKRNVIIKSKPFAVGLRFQTLQSLIDKNQYGIIDKTLPPASYKLTYKASTGRGVYSFCMCPGGYVVNASSNDKQLVINGMSNHKRDSGYANSATIVTVNEKDYGNGPLDGIKYQKKLESKAYELGNSFIPVQLYKDFKNKQISKNLGSIQPKFKGQYQLSDLSSLFNSDIYKTLIEGIEYFDTKIKGFGSDDNLLAGVETRTSSPIRILRDNNYMCNINGIYPCGEGSGYAGGITSSAVDGIKIAEQIAKEYKNKTAID